MSELTYPEIFSLRGEVALITGGGTGIGRDIARSMHAAGATVILTGRREAELAATTKELGERAAYFVHDVTQLDTAADLVARVEQARGPITCLVNNAGQNLKKPAVETSDAEFEAIFRTHVLGAHALTRAVAPGMIQRGRGNVLFTASMASLFGIPLVIAYTAAKAAYVGLVKGYATELSPHGVRVNAIAPGWIDTAMSRKAFAGDPARKERILSRTPMRRLGDSSDIGWAAVYLASPAANFVTGVILPVDGGVSIGF
ncbi:MAG: SDR family oxidoreductase [Opitutus sp.]|nr:SDR family oxidoreductase [Opitutus sp.]